MASTWEERKEKNNNDANKKKRVKSSTSKTEIQKKMISRPKDVEARKFFFKVVLFLKWRTRKTTLNCGWRANSCKSIEFGWAWCCTNRVKRHIILLLSASFRLRVAEENKQCSFPFLFSLAALSFCCCTALVRTHQNTRRASFLTCVFVKKKTRKRKQNNCWLSWRTNFNYYCKKKWQQL